MGYIFNFNDALSYEQWFKNPHNSFTSDLEGRLMLNMLKPMSGDSILDIGCGTGRNLLLFIEKGLHTTGLDPSPYMLDIAASNVNNRSDLHRGLAEDLPFDDNSFNYASLITTLECVENPKKALEEACRVAKDRLFIGALNRYAIKGIQRRIKGILFSTIYNHAQFFSIWELKQVIRSILGDVPVSWRTVCHFPAASGKISRSIEQSGLVQRCPFGAFIGMVVTLVPRFKTRPISIPYSVKQTKNAVAG